jgi:hypothetical protein
MSNGRSGAGFKSAVLFGTNPTRKIRKLANLSGRASFDAASQEFESILRSRVDRLPPNILLLHLVTSRRAGQPARLWRRRASLAISRKMRSRLMTAQTPTYQPAAVGLP